MSTAPSDPQQLLQVSLCVHGSATAARRCVLFMAVGYILWYFTLLCQRCGVQPIVGSVNDEAANC